jgi:hypothetical protein
VVWYGLGCGDEHDSVGVDVVYAVVRVVTMSAGERWLAVSRLQARGLSRAVVEDLWRVGTDEMIGQALALSREQLGELNRVDARRRGSQAPLSARRRAEIRWGVS